MTDPQSSAGREPRADATPGLPDYVVRVPPDGDASALHAAERRVTAARRAMDRRVMAVIEGMSDAFLAIGPDWRVTYANHEAARLNATSPGELIGVDHWSRWPETVGTEVEQQYHRVVNTRQMAEFEHYYARADVWHEIRAYPSDDGGIAVFFRDITDVKRRAEDRERHQRELDDIHAQALAAETQFRLLVEKVQDYAIFLLDSEGWITQWGAGAERVTGWAAHEVVGKHLGFIYPPTEASGDGSAESHLAHAAERGEYIGEGVRLRRDGELFPARVVLTALRNNGRLIGFSKITQDLSGDREREAALGAAMDAAHAASVAKSQFLANTSHEIRTPLNAIMGYTELLDLGLAGPLTPAQRGYLDRIQSTSQHLLGLINDVLDLSRIEAGHMRAAREPGLLRDAVISAVRLVEPQVRMRQIQLSNACATSDVVYRGDSERVRQVVVNLLSNAVRFTEPGGRVTVSCGTSTQVPAQIQGAQDLWWAFVRVEDTGVGIEPDQLDRIWDAFVQADSSRTRKVGGSGLGLTISRHLARLMGGDITVTSEPGLGSSFVLWIPAAELADAGRQAHGPPRTTAQIIEDAEGRLGLVELSDALLGETERVLSMCIARLRNDDEMPHARELRDAEAADHSATFIADLAQSLAIVGQDGPQSEALLQDGSAIQRLIAERHGAQRARHGFTQGEIRREYAILREEIHAAVHRNLVRGGGTDGDRATDVLDTLVGLAERASIDSWLATQSIATSSNSKVSSSPASG